MYRVSSTMDYSPWSKREFWPNLKLAIIISKTGEATPTKLGVHAFHFNLYLHEFFEPILIFDLHGIVHGPKGNFCHFEGKTKWSNISETREATPTKIAVHAFDINLYLHKFFELILFDSFFDPHGL